MIHYATDFTHHWLEDAALGAHARESTKALTNPGEIQAPK
ncbi:hypothetical protein NU195Hw_Modified_539t1 [Hortaea werneckii]